jgi:hypothetical protein
MSTASIGTVTERGPPSYAHGPVTAHDAVDRWSHGGSAWPAEPTQGTAATTYDDPTGLVQGARAAGTTEEQSRIDERGLWSLNPSRVAAKGGDEAFHYTSSKWIESITTNGLNKGSYATPNGSLSPLQASLELALPPNRALPDAALRIDLAGLRRAGYDIPQPTRVSSTVSSGGRTYSMHGGGYEMQFPYAIPPEFIKVVSR